MTKPLSPPFANGPKVHMLSVAQRYLRAGLSPIPCHPTEKRPLVPWAEYQKRLPTAEEIAEWFGADTRSIGLVCGKVSGGLEMIDFDSGGELFEPWRELVEIEAPDLTALPIVERSQRGGVHVVYRCPGVTIPGNSKLAQRDDGGIPKCLIETRGTGGQFLCAPSPGYSLIQGDFGQVPTITPETRELFHEAARALNTWHKPSLKTTGTVATATNGGRPGDDYNKRGDVRALLERHGWTRAGKTGDNELWRRPGKSEGWSASLHPSHGLYVFSSNAHPFDSDACYSHFSTYALLEHDGNYRKAALELAREGYGELSQSSRSVSSSEDCLDGEKDKSLSAASYLINLVRESGAELFHTPGNQQAYMTVSQARHFETLKVRGKAARTWMAGAYYAKTGLAIPAQGLKDAAEALVAQAIYHGPEHPVHVRIAERDGAVWLDLGDEQRRAIAITSSGWSVVEQPPVRFIRPVGFRPLPEPIPGGRLDDLWEFVNVTPEDRPLVLAWLIAALRARGPYPVLLLTGEQGSAKSTTSRNLRSVIDPHQLQVRTVPRSERDLMISASNAWVLSFDNLSGLPHWLSDALCRLATGGGFATRELYSDDDEVLFEAMRPLILNGIEDVATRPDLLERAIGLHLPTIARSKRRTESYLQDKFKEAHPRLLGALLDAAAAGLKRIGAVKLPELPRMADFAYWVVAAEPGLGLNEGEFLEAFQRTQLHGHEIAVDADPLAQAVLRLVQSDGRWTGTATTLLDALNTREPELRGSRSFPRAANQLSNRLRRLASSLRAIGVGLEWERDSSSHRKKLITLTWEPSSASSEPPSALSQNHLLPDDALDDADGADGAFRTEGGSDGE